MIQRGAAIRLFWIITLVTFCLWLIVDGVDREIAPKAQGALLTLAAVSLLAGVFDLAQERS